MKVRSSVASFRWNAKKMVCLWKIVEKNLCQHLSAFQGEDCEDWWPSHFTDKLQFIGQMHGAPWQRDQRMDHVASCIGVTVH